MKGTCRISVQFGGGLRELRRARKLTQAVVAGRIGCSQGHLSAIEWGERVPNLVMMTRIAAALECKLSDLTRVFDTADLPSLLRENDALASQARHLRPPRMTTEPKLIRTQW